MIALGYTTIYSEEAFIVLDCENNLLVNTEGKYCVIFRTCFTEFIDQITAL